MKITKQLLKEMIEEELASINEGPSKDGPSKEDMVLGKALNNTELGQELFQKMDANPEIQKALAQIEKQMSENENVGGQYAFLGGAGGAVAKGGAINKAFWSGILSGKAGAAAMGILKAAGIAAPAVIGGAIAGYLLYKGIAAVAGE